jgi:hypothetical protein
MTMARDPTTEELAQLRALLAAAGSKREFERWTRLAASKRRGRPPIDKFGGIDAVLIWQAEGLFRGGERWRDPDLKAMPIRPPLAAIKIAVERNWHKHLGASKKAVEKRIRSRLAPGGTKPGMWPALFSKLDDLEIAKALRAGPARSANSKFAQKKSRRFYRK